MLEAPSTRTGRAKDAVRKAALAVEDYVLAPPSDMATDGFITTTTVPFAAPSAYTFTIRSQQKDQVEKVVQANGVRHEFIAKGQALRGRTRAERAVR